MAIFTAIIAMLPSFSGAVTIFGLSPGISAAIIATGRAALWSLASSALYRPSLPRQQVMATISQTDMPRIRAYGRNLSGGLRVLFEANGGRLHQIVVFHHGAIDSLTRFWMDGQPLAMAPNADGLYRKDGYTTFAYRDGSGAGGDYGGVFGDGGPDPFQAFPGIWTPQHRLQGQATFHVVFGDPSDEDFVKYYPKGPNSQVQIEYRGVRVRNGAGDLVYSENAGLCIRDLMTHRDGWAMPESVMDAESWAAFAARCAEPVPQLSGGTDIRYRLCGYYSLDDALKEVTARMLATCDGQIYQTPEGKVGILGGAWSVPDVTITADDILGVMTMRDGFDPLSDYNVLKGSFVSPAHAYQSTEVQELRDEVALETQEERVEQFDVDMCPSSSQMQRLMKIRYAKDHRAWVGTLRTNLVGMKARFPKGDGIHTIRVVAPEFGLNGVFEVTSHSYDLENRQCAIGIASLENPYGWSAAQEKPLPPGIEDILLPSGTAPAMTGIALTQEPVIVSGDVKGSKLVVNVADPGRGDLELWAQFSRGNVAAEGPWPNPQPVWTDMAGNQTRAETPVLDDGETYTVRVRWRRYTGWVKAGSVAAVADPNPPPAPTNFNSMASGQTTYLDWINPDTGLWRVEVWRSVGSSNIANATLLARVSGIAGQPGSYNDAPGVNDDRYFWIRTLNASRIPSGFVGPRSALI